MVIVLNNDVIVERDFIAPLVRHFGRMMIPLPWGRRCFIRIKSLNFGRAKGISDTVFFSRVIGDSASAVNSLYACAGGGYLDKDKFLNWKALMRITGFTGRIWIYVTGLGDGAGRLSTNPKA